MGTHLEIFSRPSMAEASTLFAGLTPAAAVLILPADRTRVSALISHNMTGGASAMWIGGSGVSVAGNDYFVSATAGAVGSLRVSTTDAVYALAGTGSTGAVRVITTRTPGPAGRVEFTTGLTGTLTSAAAFLLLPADPARKRFILTHNMAGGASSSLWLGGPGVSQAGTDVLISTGAGATGVILGSTQAVYALPTTGATGVVRTWVERYV